MDGNGRWAKRRHLPRIAGHRAGVAAVRSTIETAARIGIPALTLYSFSTENWKRPKSEVSFLMNLLRRYLMMELPTMMENNIRLQYIGRQYELPQEVQERMAWARESTEKNTGMVLTLALNYSSRTELVDCFNALAREASRNGGLDHMRVDEKRYRAAPLHPRTARARPADSDQRRDAAEQFPFCGRQPTPRFSSRTPLARLSRQLNCWKRSRPSRSASVASADSSATDTPRETSPDRGHPDSPCRHLALFKAPLWLFTLLVFGVAVLAAHEYFGIVKAQGFRPFAVDQLCFV